MKQKYENSKILVTVSKAVIYLIFFSIAITQLGVGTEIIPILVSAFAWSIACWHRSLLSATVVRAIGGHGRSAG